MYAAHLKGRFARQLVSRSKRESVASSWIIRPKESNENQVPEFKKHRPVRQLFHPGICDILMLSMTPWMQRTKERGHEDHVKRKGSKAKENRIPELQKHRVHFQNFSIVYLSYPIYSFDLSNPVRRSWGETRKSVAWQKRLFEHLVPLRIRGKVREAKRKAYC